jgi:hypothetical protein
LVMSSKLGTGLNDKMFRVEPGADFGSEIKAGHRASV